MSVSKPEVDFPGGEPPVELEITDIWQGDGPVANPVGFQNSATRLDLGFYAARSYSLRRPARTGLRLIRFWDRSATG
jgi:hypothetical protein